MFQHSLNGVYSGTPSGQRGFSQNNPQERILVNHFKNISCLVTKTGVHRSLSRFYEKIVRQHVHTISPTTFIVKNEDGNEEWSKFQARYREISLLTPSGGGGTNESPSTSARGIGSPLQPTRTRVLGEEMPLKHCFHNMWLLKPAGLNQGRGIQVMSEYSAIKRFLKKQPLKDEWVIQKYIEAPQLFDGRKFDIRVWVVVTEEFDINFYRQGYIRTSSEAFTTNLKAPSDGANQSSMVHLTNYCMQKHSRNLGKFEVGNTLSFKQYQAYLDQQYPELNINFEKMVMPRVKMMTVDVLLSTRFQLHQGNEKGSFHRRHCFELFGLDFMIDEVLSGF